MRLDYLSCRRSFRIGSKWNIPGGALAIMRDGELLLARGYGLADVEQEERVRPESLFRIASISKPIRAVAVMNLVEEGRLRLDMRASALLDDFRPAEGGDADPRVDRITVRQLLEHSAGWDASSGFDPMFSTREIAELMGVSAPADCATTIRYMRRQPLDFDPGSRYAYSNFGYCVLGRIVESASGQTYEEYVTSEILDPMGIERMRLGQTMLSGRYADEVRYYDYAGADLATPVFPEIDGPAPWPYGGFHLEAMDAHGGWVGSATDLVRFVWGLESSNPSAVLQADTVSTMLAHPAPPLWEGRSSYCALGWRVRPARKDSDWWHTGSLPGSSAILYRRSDGITWAALFNTRPNTQGDDFLVDVITAMGRAAMLQSLSGILPVILGGVAAAGALLAVLVRKKRTRSGVKRGGRM
ncbi:MAG: serine hydrolase domain-containing protein [Anaerolineae bacterium]